MFDFAKKLYKQFCPKVFSIMKILNTKIEFILSWLSESSFKCIYMLKYNIMNCTIKIARKRLVVFKLKWTAIGERNDICSQIGHGLKFSSEDPEEN